MQKDNGKRFERFAMKECCSRGGQPFEYGVYQPRGRFQRNHNAAILYRTTTLGSVEPIPELQAAKKGLRSVVAVYIPKFHLVFLSVWLDHQYNHSFSKVETLESIGESLEIALTCMGTPPVRRVIAAMDSNDFSGKELLGKSFTLCGKTLQISGKPCRTCAEDVNFRGVGDCIFDSGGP
jgi:hypothetical protein